MNFFSTQQIPKIMLNFVLICIFDHAFLIQDILDFLVFLKFSHWLSLFFLGGENSIFFLYYIISIISSFGDRNRCFDCIGMKNFSTSKINVKTLMQMKNIDNMELISLLSRAHLKQ